MKHIYTTRNRCRVCDGVLEVVWDLGLQFIYSLKENNAAPLCLCVCKKCELVQLKHTVDPSVLYGGEYYYKSGVNDSMRASLKDVVDCARKRVKLSPTDIVVDIGSNDGTLLSFYGDMDTVGFEPSKVKNTHPIFLRFDTYFSASEFQREFYESRASVITACAMFYDLDDPLHFLNDIRKVLDDDGLFIIQMNYLCAMVDNCNFDNISHEHLCYYSIRDMKRLCTRVGLHIEDAELNEVNGGSIRLYITKYVEARPLAQSDRLVQLIEEERVWYEEPMEKDVYVHEIRRGIMDRIDEMAQRALFIADDLKKIVEGKRVCAVGASTRGYVILQYADLELPLIDRNPEKVGKSLGNMPILSEKDIDDYEYGIILPYHFKYEMQERYKNNKIKLVVPIPEVRVLEYS